MIVYFDASALVKLVIEEQGSSEVASLWRSTSHRMSARIAWIEVHSTIARKRRRRELSDRTGERARAAWGLLWASIGVIELTPELIDVAADVTYQYGLTALDAIHLASFLALLEAAGPADEIRFSSFDSVLAAAARAVR